MISTLKLIKHIPLAQIFGKLLGLCALTIVIFFQINGSIIIAAVVCFMLLLMGVKDSMNYLAAYKQSLQENQLVQEDLDKQSKF